ncbi:MAG: SRPBCC family protein [Mycobacteriaceae bacterium]
MTETTSSATAHTLQLTATEGLPFIDMTRRFSASVSVLFRAHSEPALVQQWLGPYGYDMEIKEYNFTTGGRYQYLHRNPEGSEFLFHGVFHVVRPNDFVIQTFEFEGYPDTVSIESQTFIHLGEQLSELKVHSVYPSMQARDGMLAGGMAEGVEECYERLEKLVASL